MSTYDLEEQEQLAALRAWWKDHGGAIILGATLVLAAVGAWNAWTWYQRSQSAQAAVLYDALQKAARANDLKTTRETAGGDPGEFSAWRFRAAPGAGLGQGPV